jgi:hypothetical protein
MEIEKVSMKGRRVPFIPFEGVDGADRPIMFNGHVLAEFNQTLRKIFGVKEDTSFPELFQLLLENQKRLKAMKEGKKPENPGPALIFSDAEMCKAVDGFLKYDHADLVGALDLETYADLFGAAMVIVMEFIMGIGEATVKKKTNFQQSSPES